jgi:hypothetical protein
LVSANNFQSVGEKKILVFFEVEETAVC